MSDGQIDANPEEAFAAYQAARSAQQAQPALTQRQREQIAQARAQMATLQRQVRDAEESGQTDQIAQIQTQMEKLAARETARQQRAVTYAQVTGSLTGRSPGALTEGQPPQAVLNGPAGYGALDAAEAVARRVNERKDRLKQAWLALPTLDEDITAEAGRQALGDAIQMAVNAGTITELQALRMVAVGGLNSSSFSLAEVRALMFDLLAQATRSEVLSLTRARTIATLIQEAPQRVNEAEVAVPEPEAAVDPAGLRALALKTLGVTRSPMTPTGRELAQDALQTLARAVPDLVDQIDRLERALYQALLILPCHAGHELHLQTPMLCDEQGADVTRTLMAELGLSSRELPRDVHRDPDGARASCCVKDGRVGTWLVYGQYLNPELGFASERRAVQARRAKTESAS